MKRYRPLSDVTANSPAEPEVAEPGNATDPKTADLAAAIPLARPDIGEVEKALVAQVLNSDTLSRGPMVDRFEQAFAQFTGAREAVALSSGSAALHLAIRALDLPPEAEVLTSPFSVPATANMILAAGARLKFCDISPTHLGLDPAQVACSISDQTAAVLPVHVFGQPADIKEMRHVCELSEVTLIEDACEALGTRVDGQALGTFGQMGCFGFYPNKQITTGEGGMLITDDPQLAERVRLMRNHGRTMAGPWHDQQWAGLNYRMPELSAALGLGQLQRMDHIMAQRQTLASCYRQYLSALPGLRPVADSDTDISWFAMAVILHPELPRDVIIDDLARQGIGAGRYFAPLHQQPALAPLVADHGPFPVAEGMAARALALPFFTTMTQDQVTRVCDSLGESIQRLQGA